MTTFADVLAHKAPAAVLCADALDGLKTLPDACVDVAATSPPYFHLRSYLDKDHPDKHREIGLETSLADYVKKLVAVFAEVRRVLKPTGSLFVNIGDSFQSTPPGNKNYNSSGLAGAAGSAHYRERLLAKDNKETHPREYPDGCLLMVPERFALAMIDDAWVLRQTLVWAKVLTGDDDNDGSCMPESVSGWSWRRCRKKVGSKDMGAVNPQKSDRTGQTPQKGLAGHSGGAGVYIPAATWVDCPGCAKCEKTGGYVLRRGAWRCTRAHEMIYHFTKEGQRYYGDAEAVRVAVHPDSPARFACNHKELSERDTAQRTEGGTDRRLLGLRGQAQNEGGLNHAGSNPRSVLRFTAEPGNSTDDHLAQWPRKIPRWCFKACASTKGCCPACGAPWCRVVHKEQVFRQRPNRLTKRQGKEGEGNHCPNDVAGTRTSTVGWSPTCTCNAGEPVPSLTLDPFCGSGQTGAAAVTMGLRFVGIDLNEKFCGLARHVIAGVTPRLLGGF